MQLPIERSMGKVPKTGISLVSKLVLSCFFLLFAGMGTFFLVMMIREILGGKAELTLILFLLLPLVFIVVGAGGIWGTWFYKIKDKSELPKGSRINSGKRIALLVGGLFIVVGVSTFYGFGVRPFMKNRQAQQWVQTPCRIIAASVGSHDSDDGTTYSIDITYAYEFNGKSYRGDRYDFVGGSSSGYEGKAQVVRQYQLMENPVCYVNPNSPDEAVLVRELTARYAVGLIPLVFAAVGGLLVWGTLKKRDLSQGTAWLPEISRSKANAAERPYAFLQENPMASESVTLTATDSGWSKLVKAAVICLFWNGIISVFIYNMIAGFRSGNPDWFLTVFLVPFELIGLVTIGAVFYQWLALFNPRYSLILQPGRLYPGSVGYIHYSSIGKVGRVKELTMKLVGEERATYQQGSNTRTETRAFYEMELVKTSDPADIAGGDIGFAIPSETMHSFEADNNKVVWSVTVRGDIRRWPDTKQDFKIIVSPVLTAENAKL
jgi:hypothetical protein